MPRRGNLHKPMTVERALAEAHKAGCIFRLAGAGIVVRGINAVPADVVTFLRGNGEAVFAHLGGTERDRPSLELLSALDVELVSCTDDATAESSLPRSSPTPVPARSASISKRPRCLTTRIRSRCDSPSAGDR